MSRFLILTQYFHPEVGAPQVRLTAMARELLRLGHEVEIVTALPNYPQGKIFAEYKHRFYVLEHWENIKIHRVWMYTATGAGFKRLFSYLSFVLTAFYGLRKAQRPDYLFVESPPLFLGITGFLTAKIWKIPFIFNIADLWPDYVRALDLMSDGVMFRSAGKLEKYLYQKANYINVVTKSAGDVLIRNKGVPAHKILFLPNGIDTKIFKPYPIDFELKKRFNLPDKPMFLYAGTHGYAHGMDVILESAKLLAKTEFYFLLVGGGSEKPRLQKLCKQMQLNNVVFLDPQSPEIVAHLYSLAIAGIATVRPSSLLDSMRSAKILAIMACEKPVLYSGATGESARLIAEANAGIILESGKAKELVKEIKYLLNNPDQAQKLGQNGKIYIEKYLQWSIVIKTWLQQLQDK